MLLLLVGLFAPASAKVIVQTPSLPNIVLKTSWNSQVNPWPESYGSIALKVSEEGYVHVMNGAEVGNEIDTFTTDGRYMGRIPGWYNFPVDMVLHQNNQTLLSAIGAMGDNHMMRFGMVLYNSSGEFFHGFHEANTGLVRPYGLSIVSTQGQMSRVAVCDWGNNQTRFLEVDWEQGSIATLDIVINVPYPTSVGISGDKLAVVSDVCCETWHEPMRKVSLFNSNGHLLAEAKDLPTGERLNTPQKVSVDPSGNFLVIDQGMNKTLLFNSDLEYMGELSVLGAPDYITFHQNQLFSLTNKGTTTVEVHKVFVYDYTY